MSEGRGVVDKTLNGALTLDAESRAELEAITIIPQG